MSATVVDTNVILVANGAHADVTDECIESCVLALHALTQKGVVVIDDAHLILSEYGRKTSPRKGKGVGDVFVKWLYQNMGTRTKCHQVSLTEHAENDYAEFPVPALIPAFDAPDRKFAAVANAHPDKPPILQAADCKWLDWHDQLHAAGIAVKFICPADAQQFYRKKFPKKPMPQFPR
jgi:hypothetical protein